MYKTVPEPGYFSKITGEFLHTIDVGTHSKSTQSESAGGGSQGYMFPTSPRVDSDLGSG